MTFEVSYSRLDRLLHNVAFCHPVVQKVLASIEDDIFARRLSHIELGGPVFITSLPRAGTTLLLEVLAAHPDFATHTYRDMPFVLSPMLWDGLSRRFRRAGGYRARAHDDGMIVGYDTPEAFEEVAWRTFWPEKYLADRIEPWTGEEDPGEFETLLSNHMRKLVALRAACDGGKGGRYLSKNNANIARIRMIERLFPDARILVPVRHPFDHVRSLLRQHRNFMKLHGEDRFGRRYMESIGHFEFGEALKPIDMGGWLAGSGGLSPFDADYWLEYWIGTFETLLAQQSDRLVLLSYERCCAAPERSLSAIADVLAIADPQPLLQQAGRFHAPAPQNEAAFDGNATRRDRALTVFQAVLSSAIN